MEVVTSWLSATLPLLVFALVALLVGLLLAWQVGRFGAWLVEKTGLDALAERLGVSKVLYAAGLKRSLASVVGWLLTAGGVLLTVAVVAEMAGLGGVAEGIAALAAWVPVLVTAGLILLGGLFAADLLRNIVHRVAERRGDVDAPGFLAQAVYVLVVVVTVSMAAETLGLETGIVNALIQIAAAAGLGGLALGFALGGRPVIGGLVATHYARRMFRPGDRVRVGDVVGVVEGFGPLTLWVRAEQGLVAVPSSQLIAGMVTVEAAAPPSAAPDDAGGPTAD